MKKISILLTMWLFAACSFATLPQQFSNMYFFGDELTDQGNYVPERSVPCFKEPAPQVNTTSGKLSGKTWAEQFANHYGLNALPSSKGGTNYAKVGAQTVDIFRQATQYLATHGQQADPNALYVIWGGAQDLFQKVMEKKLPPAQVLIDGVEETLEVAELLAKHGAKHILIIGLQDASITPFIKMAGEEAQNDVHQFTYKWNKLLMTSLGYMRQGYPAVHFYGWDPIVTMQAMHTDPSQFSFPKRVFDESRDESVPNDSTWWCGFNMGSDVDEFMFFGPMAYSSAYHAQIVKNIIESAG